MRARIGRIGRAVVAAVVVTSTVAALGSVPARACWDGSTASVGDVSVWDFDETWSVERAEQRARWLTRIDRLLPEGATLQVEWGQATLALDDRTVDWDWNGRLADLFERTAREVRANPVSRLTARLTPAPKLWTIQAGSFATRAQAVAQAERIDGGSDCGQGFFEAGGFPADNPATMIERAPDTGDARYRVLVGIYLSRAEAEAARACLDTIIDPEGAEDQAIAGFVRGLAPRAPAGWAKAE